ncbi:MAG: sugar phosphate isomerase/epimerase [Abitibacteriaceae bacterium]|nr:sugar phosphate isomerase/epimerase [Abditibacteriaceae bacterium]
MNTTTKMDVAVRDAMLPVKNGESCFSLLHALEVTSVELLVDREYRLPGLNLRDGSTPFLIDTLENAAHLKARLDAEGVRVAALLLMTDFSADEADQHVEWSVRATRAAQELGSPAVRIDTATRNTTLSVPQIRDNFVRRISQVLGQTANTGVDLGIENHGHISNDPQFLDEVFAAVGDERLGMTLDTGNFYWYGHPLSKLYEILERFAPRAKHTHIKNINYPPEMVETQREIGYEYGRYCCPLDEGNIDIHRVVQILRDAGYTRDLCIENEALGKYTPEERAYILQRDVQALRAGL